MKSDTAPSRAPTTAADGTDGIAPLLLSVAAAARSLGIGQSLMYELLAAGEFRVVRIGRRVLLPVKALEEWIEARSEGPLASRLAVTGATAAQESTPAWPEGTRTSGLGIRSRVGQ